MSNNRDTGLPDLRRLQDDKAAVEAEIRALQDLPQRLLREQQERMTTLPPSDLIETRRKEKVFDDRVSRTEVINQKREITRSLLIMVLLVIAALVMLWWAYSSLQRFGIL
ncbi:MAG: hypothetical protein B9S37_06280 [Verrucomicrobiia bacterium Tous-C3TDCM]|jgi:hypothetical protein|nr:MAG: hypothetical protein B9S37_06280 [Verrucomicrobiae bacterium Tous-C3TDCM]PAZ04195.1 MAG: hypothetical protein CAK88_12450 [Verrucomicrobiae bacterium AMD-G2]